jgi:hypothetical protein
MKNVFKGQSGLFIGEKKLRVIPTILKSSVHSILLVRMSGTVYSIV